MARLNFKSISLATALRTLSSSCSLAGLAAARALIAKGASIVASVAFMFASTNLVFKLGLLVLIFLGWPCLVAEVMSGLVLIAIRSLLIHLTAPQRLQRKMRTSAEADSPNRFVVDALRCASVVAGG